MKDILDDENPFLTPSPLNVIANILDFCPQLNEIIYGIIIYTYMIGKIEYHA